MSAERTPKENIGTTSRSWQLTASLLLVGNGSDLKKAMTMEGLLARSLQRDAKQQFLHIAEPEKAPTYSGYPTGERHQPISASRDALAGSSPHDAGISLRPVTLPPSADPNWGSEPAVRSVSSGGYPLGTSFA